MKLRLNEKQKKFCKYYLISFNATESAKKAGYSNKTAYSIGHNQLKKVEVQKYLKELSIPIDNKLKINREEILFILTKIARGETKEYEFKYDGNGKIIWRIVKDSVANRLKALELLGKSIGLFKEESTQIFDKVIINYISIQNQNEDNTNSNHKHSK